MSVILRCLCFCFRRAKSRFGNLLALRGRAGQPGPRAENREWGETEARWNFAIVYHAVQCPENPPQSPKTQLALAIAQGTLVAEWALQNNVPRRTAFRWAGERKVRSAVENCRRRALDRAVGRMSKRVTWAADGIVKLAGSAVSESVRLAALRAIFADMMAVSDFGGLEDRITALEEQCPERTATTSYPS
jgi:hypothetical protein